MIKKLKSITKMGVLDSVTPCSPTCDFKKYNLFYGFNGCGKTTLSRILSSLGKGEISPLLPKYGSFEVELEDGRILSSGADLSQLKGQIAVFNSDYVKENFRWDEGTAEVIFYIGQDQAEASKELDFAKSKSDSLQERLKRASTEKSATKRQFSEINKKTAKSIDERILGSKYTATHLLKDFASYTFEETHKLTDASLSQIGSKIAQKNPPEPIDKLKLDLKFRVFVDNARECLEATAGTAVLEELSAHKSMEKWVKEGQVYHQEHNLEDCLFCGNRISKERLEQIAGAIDDKFTEIGRQAQQMKATCRELDERIRTAILDDRLSKISNDNQTRLVASIATYKQKLNEALSVVKSYEQLIDSKIISTNEIVPVTNVCDRDEAEKIELAINKAVGQLNECIAEHNKEHEDFDRVKREAEGRVKCHFIALSYDEIVRLKDEVELATSLEEKAQSAVDENEKSIECLAKEVQNHGVAADAISDLIRLYLLHKDVELIVDQSTGGFQLQRNGTVVRGTLSEGEKTAVALCYFLAGLKADGKNTEDQIVVVDDPISSLDSRALNYAFGLVKAHLTNAKQLFILTHNVSFMNECKKWLSKKNRHKEDKKQASLLYFDLRMVEERRRSVIVPLPRLLLDHESEYHFLFSKVWNFANSQHHLGTDEHFMMPNAMRKVAEVFLTFKLPHKESVASQFDHICRKSEELGLDPAKIVALERLIQVESHGDNLDDLLTYSSMTIEETHDSADTLLKLIESMDKEHYQGLETQCKRESK